MSRSIGGLRASNFDNFLSAAARRVRSRLAPSEMRIAFGGWGPATNATDAVTASPSARAVMASTRDVQ
jgi:hypothetical protein